MRRAPVDARLAVQAQFALLGPAPVDGALGVHREAKDLPDRAFLGISPVGHLHRLARLGVARLVGDGELSAADAGRPVGGLAQTCGPHQRRYRPVLGPQAVVDVARKHAVVTRGVGANHGRFSVHHCASGIEVLRERLRVDQPCAYRRRM